MKKILLTIASGLVLAGNADAANKTHIMDALGAGNNRVDISYNHSQSRGNASFYYPGIGSSNADSKSSFNSLAAVYMRGITDRLDLIISVPLYEYSKSTSNTVYSWGGSSTSTHRTEGQGDLGIGARYLVLEKQQDSVNWNVVVGISPATATYDAGSAEVMQNGAVVIAGRTAKPGRGYRQTNLGTAIGIPTRGGDVILQASYTSGGERTSAGVRENIGSTTFLILGLESMLGERTTLTPSIVHLKTGTSYYGTSSIPSSSYNSFDLRMTHDVSSLISIGIDLRYMPPKTYTGSYPNSFTYSSTGKGYGLSIATMIFF